VLNSEFVDDVSNCLSMGRKLTIVMLCITAVTRMVPICCLLHWIFT